MRDNLLNMEIGESIKKVIQELILPELAIIKGEYKEIKLVLGAVNTRIDDVNKRLDDVNAHLVDQSRRIDETNNRIDETNERIDYLRVELRDEIQKTNVRIDRLYEVVVRKEEHDKLEMRTMRCEREVDRIGRKIAA